MIAHTESPSTTEKDVNIVPVANTIVMGTVSVIGAHSGYNFVPRQAQAATLVNSCADLIFQNTYGKVSELRSSRHPVEGMTSDKMIAILSKESILFIPRLKSSQTSIIVVVQEIIPLKNTTGKTGELFNAKTKGEFSKFRNCKWQ